MSALAGPLAPAAVPTVATGDPVLGAELLTHLDAQLVSAERLLAVVLDQGAAIRARDVRAVVAATGLMQAELARRSLVDRERARLLASAGVRLSVDPGAVTLELLCALIPPASAEIARARSAQLRGMLAQIRTEHHVNRALMHQELRFLDHLLRVADIERQTGYDAAGDATRTRVSTMGGHRTLDLEV